MIKSVNARDLVWVLGMLLGVLCGCPQQMEQPDTSVWSTCEAPELAPPPEQVTYHQHIKPMMQTYCVGCHYDGGPSPFALQTYEQVKQHQVAAQWAISTGSMPPWFASDCCREYANDISLPADQQALFEQWIAQGATEGVPASLPKAPRAEPAPGQQQVVLEIGELANGDQRVGKLLNGEVVGEDGLNEVHVSLVLQDERAEADLSVDRVERFGEA